MLGSFQAFSLGSTAGKACSSADTILLWQRLGVTANHSEAALPVHARLRGFPKAKLMCCRNGVSDAALIAQAVEHFSRMLFLERLRTPQDRQRLLDLYQGCWGHPLPLLPTPELCISPEYVKLGLAKLPRTLAQTDTPAGKPLLPCGASMSA